MAGYKVAMSVDELITIMFVDNKPLWNVNRTCDMKTRTDNCY